LCFTRATTIRSSKCFHIRNRQRLLRAAPVVCYPSQLWSIYIHICWSELQTTPSLQTQAFPTTTDGAQASLTCLSEATVRSTINRRAASFRASNPLHLLSFPFVYTPRAFLREGFALLGSPEYYNKRDLLLEVTCARSAPVLQQQLTVRLSEAAALNDKSESC
jgi:hypothetical protein